MVGIWVWRVVGSDEIGAAAAEEAILCYSFLGLVCTIFLFFFLNFVTSDSACFHSFPKSH